MGHFFSTDGQQDPTFGKEDAFLKPRIGKGNFFIKFANIP
jgi:hypothetical protein